MSSATSSWATRRPWVDTLSRCAVGVFGGDLLAVVLTGMGSDGLTGAGAVIAAGAGSESRMRLRAWGRPGAVAKAGLAHQLPPLDKIGGPVVAEVRHSTRDCVPAAWGARPFGGSVCQVAGRPRWLSHRTSRAEPRRPED
jgi:hypothetical protein